MGKLAACLKNDGTNFIFTGIKAECYIPLNYDNDKLYERTPESIRVFGLFPLKVFDKNDKVLFQETMNVPSMINMFPTDVVKEDIALETEEEEDNVGKFIVARFYTGDIFTPVNVIQDLDNTELFLNLLCAGKLPRLKYSQIIQTWHKNLELNGTDVGVTSTAQELIIREIYRNPNKPEETFGEYRAKNPKVSDYGYRAANIREVCARNSTFAAMSFEDLDSMITYSLNINEYNKEEKQSPVEQIIKM